MKKLCDNIRYSLDVLYPVLYIQQSFKFVHRTTKHEANILQMNGKFFINTGTYSTLIVLKCTGNTVSDVPHTLIPQPAKISLKKYPTKMEQIANIDIAINICIGASTTLVSVNFI